MIMLIKIPFIQYLYGIRSMRQTVKEIEVNVAYRWFLGLEMMDKVPHFSTFGFWSADQKRFVYSLTEGNDRLLLFFLFNFISYIEIDGYTYFRNENPHPVKPLRNACLALFPELSRYLYVNDCIPDMRDKTLFLFLQRFNDL